MTYKGLKIEGKKFILLSYNFVDNLTILSDFIWICFL